MCSTMAFFLIFAFTPSIAQRREAWKEEVLMISLERTRAGQCQSDKHLKCFKCNDGNTSERQGEAYIGLSKCIDTILNSTELKFTKEDCNPKSNNLTAYTLFYSQVHVYYNGFLSDICWRRLQSKVKYPHSLHFILFAGVCVWQWLSVIFTQEAVKNNRNLVQLLAETNALCHSPNSQSKFSPYLLLSWVPSAVWVDTFPPWWSWPGVGSTGWVGSQSSWTQTAHFWTASSWSWSPSGCHALQWTLLSSQCVRALSAFGAKQI